MKTITYCEGIMFLPFLFGGKNQGPFCIEQEETIRMEVNKNWEPEFIERLEKHYDEMKWL